MMASNTAMTDQECLERALQAISALQKLGVAFSVSGSLAFHASWFRPGGEDGRYERPLTVGIRFPVWLDEVTQEILSLVQADLAAAEQMLQEAISAPVRPAKEHKPLQMARAAGLVP